MASIICSSSARLGAVSTTARPAHVRPSLQPLCVPSTSSSRPTISARPTLVARGIPVSGPGQATPNPSGAPAGQISAELMASMKAKIQEALETDNVVVDDVYGDGRHVSITCISPAFEGKNAVQRQRMVYKAIWLELQEAVHAVDEMVTKTPAEIGAK